MTNCSRWTFDTIIIREIRGIGQATTKFHTLIHPNYSIQITKWLSSFRVSLHSRGIHSSILCIFSNCTDLVSFRILSLLLRLSWIIFTNFYKNIVLFLDSSNNERPSRSRILQINVELPLHLQKLPRMNSYFQQFSRCIFQTGIREKVTEISRWYTTRKNRVLSSNSFIMDPLNNQHSCATTFASCNSLF